MTLQRDCGFTNNQDWRGGRTEISVIEMGISYWIQVDEKVDTSILLSLKKGDTFSFFGRLISEHFVDKAITFLILEKMEEQK